MALAKYEKAYNSFSGVDIKAVFGSKPVGDIQAVSYSITREKAPIYTMGSADPRSFSRAKRGIAGSLIFIVFDRHALIGLAQSAKARFSKDRDEIKPVFGADNKLAPEATSSSLSGVTFASLVFDAESPVIGNSDQEADLPWYSDQIPPFDITLAASNEYGANAKMAIFGVEILNEGSGFSIDDIVVEQQYTYVARSVAPWQALKATPDVGWPVDGGPTKDASR